MRGIGDQQAGTGCGVLLAEGRGGEQQQESSGMLLLHGTVMALGCTLPSECCLSRHPRMHPFAVAATRRKNMPSGAAPPVEMPTFSLPAYLHAVATMLERSPMHPPVHRCAQTPTATPWSATPACWLARACWTSAAAPASSPCLPPAAAPPPSSASTAASRLRASHRRMWRPMGWRPRRVAPSLLCPARWRSWRRCRCRRRPLTERRSSSQRARRRRRRRRSSKTARSRRRSTPRQGASGAAGGCAGQRVDGLRAAV